MSSFLEIGEIVEAIPNPVKVVDIPKVAPTPPVNVPNPESNGNGWGWILLIAVVAGGALIYYNTKKNENTNTSNES